MEIIVDRALKDILGTVRVDLFASILRYLPTPQSYVKISRIATYLLFVLVVGTYPLAIELVCTAFAYIVGCNRLQLFDYLTIVMEGEIVTAKPNKDSDAIICCSACTFANPKNSNTCEMCHSDLRIIDCRDAKSVESYYIDSSQRARQSINTKQKTLGQKGELDESIAQQIQFEEIEQRIRAHHGPPHDFVDELQEISLPLYFYQRNKLADSADLMLTLAYNFDQGRGNNSSEAKIGYCFLPSCLSYHDALAFVRHSEDELCVYPRLPNFNSSNDEMVVMVAFWVVPESVLFSWLFCLDTTKKIRSKSLLPLVCFPSKCLDPADPNHAGIAVVESRLQFALDGAFCVAIEKNE